MIRRRFTLALLGVLAATLAMAPAQAAPATGDRGVIGSFKLPGSAEVITSEDHDAPWAVVDTFVAAGSSSDFPGYEGVAAATAYAVWNGSKQDPAAAIAQLGGQSRVEVDRTVTHFQAKLPAAKVADGIAAIGEAFSHPDWAALDLDRTARAFTAAAHEALDEPTERAFQLFLELAYDPTFGHPVFGRGPMHADRADIQAFFEHYYVPSRLVVVLAGDVDTGKAVGQVVRGYAAVLKRSPSLEKLPSRQAPGGVRTALHPVNALVLVGARGPDISNQREQAAMELLAKVLAGSPTARIDRALAAVGGAHVTSARWVRYAGPGALLVEISADNGNASAVEKGVRDIVGELRTNPITLDEHARAMNAVVGEEEATLRGLDTRARALGLATVGAHDPYWVRTYPEEIRQVSRQDIMAVAQKYLASPDLQVLVVKP